jgi:hypothetical protein
MLVWPSRIRSIVAHYLVAPTTTLLAIGGLMQHNIATIAWPSLSSYDDLPVVITDYESQTGTRRLADGGYGMVVHANDSSDDDNDNQQNIINRLMMSMNAVKPVLTSECSTTTAWSLSTLTHDDKKKLNLSSLSVARGSAAVAIQRRNDGNIGIFITGGEHMISGAGNDNGEGDDHDESFSQVSSTISSIDGGQWNDMNVELRCVTNSGATGILSVNDHQYWLVVGGVTPAGPVSRVEIMDITHYDNKSSPSSSSISATAATPPKWVDAQSLQRDSSNAANVVHDNRLYVFGGEGFDVASNDVSVLQLIPSSSSSIPTCVWSSLPSIPVDGSVAHGCAISIHDGILLCGGQTIMGDFTTIMYLYTPTTKLWTRYSHDLPSQLYNPSSSVVYGDTYDDVILAGSDGGRDSPITVWTLRCHHGMQSIDPSSSTRGEPPDHGEWRTLPPLPSSFVGTTLVTITQ